MLTHGVKGDVFFQHDFIIFYRKLLQQMLIRFMTKTSVNFFTHAGNPVRSINQTFPCDIFTDTFQKQTDCLLNFRFVNH